MRNGMNIVIDLMRFANCVMVFYYFRVMYCFGLLGIMEGRDGVLFGKYGKVTRTLTWIKVGFTKFENPMYFVVMIMMIVAVEMMAKRLREI